MPEGRQQFGTQWNIAIATAFARSAGPRCFRYGGLRGRRVRGLVLWILLTVGLSSGPNPHGRARGGCCPSSDHARAFRFQHLLKEPVKTKPKPVSSKVVPDSGVAVSRVAPDARV
jgi:hypothetical protein